jgi:hypothetical protein
VTLKQRFPVAPTWGQPDSNGGGVVSTDAGDGAVVAGAREVLVDQVGQRRSKRAKKPNFNVIGVSSG